MTEEQKELVIKDLSARVPYGVRLWLKCFEGESEYFINGNNILGSVIYHRGEESNITLINGGSYCIEGHSFQNYQQVIKPYLRPMSSMTEDEKNKLKEYLGAEEVDCTGFGYIEGGTLEDYVPSIPYTLCSYVINWLNAHHFDYRHLIGKGLALPAPEGMYNT